MNMISKLAVRTVCAVILVLIVQHGIARAQNTVETFKQSLDRPASKIQFDVESNLVSASGDFSDYVGRIELAPKDLSKSIFAFTINLADVDLDSGAPQMNFIIQNLFASIPDPKVSFNSSRVEVISPTRLAISGPVRLNRQLKQISFITNLSEVSPTRSRFRGELNGHGFNPVAAQPLNNNQGGFAGKVTFDLVFKR